MRGFKIAAIALLGAGLVAAGGVVGHFATRAQTPAEAPAEQADVVVARVNGQEIMRSDLLAAYAQLPAQAQQMGMELIYPILLERVIDEKLVGIAAQENLAADDPEVEAQMAELRSRVMTQIYFNRLLDEKVTEEKLKESYDKFLASNPAEEEVSARHILLETEERAKEVLVEIQGGMDFEEAARQYSTGPSAPSGGNLGFFTAGAMVKPFSDAAFAMKPGEISTAPVQTDFGWHLIKVEDRRAKPQPTFEDMRDQLEQEQQQEVASEILDGLRGAATIEKFDIEGNLPPEPAPEEAPAAEQPAATEGEQPAQQ